MNVMHSEWRGRLNHWIRTLKEDLYRPLGEIKWKAFRTMEHLSLEEVQQGPFEPVAPGYTWGNQWEYAWFAGEITLPEEAEGKRIVMDLKPGGESTLFVNGQAFGTYRADWVKEPHHYIEDNILTRKAKAGEQYSVLMETYAGHYYPNYEAVATGPVLPGSYEDPAVEGERCTLGRSTFGVWNEDAYQLYMDVMTLKELLEILEPTSLRAAKVAKALEQFTLIADFEQDEAARDVSYRAAREAVRPAMEAENGSTMPVFCGIGNAHLDLAWLWPMAETHRKTARTFAAQLRLIDEYPDYKFIQSQPASYEMCRKYYPELFERIRAAIKKGQWIADGAMWVEPDTNMASGEALIRQILYGKKYYKEVLEVDSHVLWLPDTFGYTAALPQILKGCGVDYLVTQKIFWSYNEGEPFPYHYFSWQGMDGSRVTSFLPTDYTYQTDPKTITDVWRKRTQVNDLETFLFPFGYGDGGGGPARDFVEFAERQKNLEGAARFEMMSPYEYFQRMDEKGGPVNTYVGELYFTAHRGTYTSQAMVKAKNRACEFALREMEIWSSAAVKKGMAYDQEEADELWRRFLLHQFHDILPGSSIGRVYKEAEVSFNKILEDAGEIKDRAVRFLTEEKERAVSILNSLGFSRKVLVAVDSSFAGGAVTEDGKVLPVLRSGEEYAVYAEVPAFSAVTIWPARTGSADGMPAADSDRMLCTAQSAVSTSAQVRFEQFDLSQTACGKEAQKDLLVAVQETDGAFVLENNRVKAVINPCGEVLSFINKESGRECAAEAMNRFHLYKDVPRKFDAWDIDSNYILQEIPDACRLHVTKASAGICGEIRLEGRIGNSFMKQTIRLAPDSRRLEFDTEIDWKELHRLLKTAFPVTVHAETAVNEIQFGYIERPTHRSRMYDKERFEVCNHRYTALHDGSHGAAILNNCKYGISVNGNSMELTLLRAAAAPEMRADNRVHRFSYAFTAWEGSFAECDVAKQGLDFNVRPSVVSGKVETGLELSVDRDHVIMDTVKPAQDGSGDLILRLYDAKKCAGPVVLTVPGEYDEAASCDLLEKEKEALAIKNHEIKLSFRAFEIKTIRLKKKG